MPHFRNLGRSILIINLIGLLFLSGCSIPKFSTSSVADQKEGWENLDQGVRIEKVTLDKKNLIILNIDPQKYSLQIIQNDPKQELRQSIQEIHENNSSLATFNGSFFSKDYQPTGLLISNGQELSGLVKAELLNGVFWIGQDKIPHLSAYQDYKKLARSVQPEFAIQNGPILINTDGQLAISADSSTKKASRTAIGLDASNNIVIILLKQTLLDSENSLSLYEFAKLVQTSQELKDFKIHSLLNLDGGTSTGLATNQQYYPELEKVQNVIITKKRAS
jgi:uncharacterized protein YigE (DUF2233 family)